MGKGIRLSLKEEKMPRKHCYDILKILSKHNLYIDNISKFLLTIFHCFGLEYVRTANPKDIIMFIFKNVNGITYHTIFHLLHITPLVKFINRLNLSTMIFNKILLTILTKSTYVLQNR